MLLPCAESAAKTVRTAASVEESRVFHPFRGPPLFRNSIAPLFPTALALALVPSIATEWCRTLLFQDSARQRKATSAVTAKPMNKGKSVASAAQRALLVSL